MNTFFRTILIIFIANAYITNVYSQKIKAKVFHAWAQCSDGSSFRWGYNADGELGDGTTTNRSSAVLLTSLTNITESSPNGDHSLLLKSNGTVWASGNNSYGQLGTGNNTNQLSFVQVNTITNAIAVATGYDGSYALTNTGNVYSWGENSFGSVGDGTTIHRNTPVLLAGLSGIIAIDGSTDNGYALKNDGTVWAWGWNTFGQIGDGTTTQRNAPVQVSGLSNVTAISSNGYHCLALKSDGTVWAWGYNGNGQLGDGTTTNRNIPIQVPGLTNVASISAGYLHSLAVKTNGTVWAWGGNNFGQLGDGTTVDKLVPTQAISLIGIATSVSGGLYSSYAVKIDGTIWSWGWNVFGQLGDGTTTDRINPVLITGVVCTILPIELLYFNANCVNNTIKLSWSTATESNNNFFTIEKSTDGISFIPIQAITGAGNSTQLLNYDYTDNSNSQSETYYYRLKQTDFNGEYKYSNIQSVEPCNEKNSEVYFSNPTNGLVQITFSEPNIEIKYAVVDNLGQTIISGNLSNTQNTINLVSYADGIYYLLIKTNNKEINKKIIVQH